MADVISSEDNLRLLGIFHPYAMKRLRKLEDDDIRLVHYTTAEAAISIIREETFWMRNISCMDDYMEVEQGLGYSGKVYDKKVGQLFKSALDRAHPGIVDDVAALFFSWRPKIKDDTFIACFSEHDDDEDTHGRLSMWRAYSKSTGVALVLNNAPFVAGSSPLGVYSSPVAYYSYTKFKQEWQRIVQNIEDNLDFLNSLSRKTVIDSVFNMYRFAVLCTKHPGFNEEREWRALYTPEIDKSQYIEKSIEVFRGTPQVICKVPLKDPNGIDLFGTELHDFLDRIIIGPTKYPGAIREAFEDVLEGVGVQDPTKRVFVSGIPLRL